MVKPRNVPGEPIIPGDVTGVKKEPDTAGVPGTHVHIETQESLKSDLEYLAGKAGIDLDILRAEKRKKEELERLKPARERFEKSERARLAREAAHTKEFFERQNKSIFVFVNKKPIIIKDFENVKCPFCSHTIGMQIRGRVFDLLETNPFIEISRLAPIMGIFSIHEKIHCTAPTRNGRHEMILQIQQIALNCDA